MGVSEPIVEVEPDINKHPYALQCVLLALVVISAGFDFFSGLLETIWSKNKYFALTLSTLYRELAILGIVSFLLNFANEFDFAHQLSYATAERSSDIRQVLSFVHISLFVVVLFYIFMVVYLLILSARAKSYWMTVQSYNSDVVEANAEMYRNSQEERKSSQSWFLMCHDFGNWVRARKWAELYEYHCIRNLFLEQHHLSESFPFVVYLVNSMQSRISSIIAVNWKIWLFLFVVILANILRVKYLFHIKSDRGVLPFLIIGYLLLLVGVVVYFKCCTIMSQICEVAPKFGLGKRGLGDDATEKEIREKGFVSVHRKLFWFRSPGFLHFLIQLSTAFQAIYFGLFTVIFIDRFMEHSMGPVFFVAAVIPPVINLFVLTPSLLPVYIAVSSVGCGSDSRLIYELTQTNPGDLAATFDSPQKSQQRQGQRGGVVDDEL